jgi:transposase InsO family protein
VLRDRDSTFTARFAEVVAAAGLAVLTSAVRVPRMNSLMERWVRSCRAELLDCTLGWAGVRLRHAWGEYEQFWNGHRPHRGLPAAVPWRPLPILAADASALDRMRVCRRDRLGGILRGYSQVA